MKNAREIALSAASSPAEAVRRILRIRFAECLEKQHALAGSDDEAVHAFRLACKRLRYAIERFEQTRGTLAAAAQVLSSITDELGAAHDCTVLASYAADCGADLVERRVRADRNRSIGNAARIWRRGFQPRGSFAALAAFTGFHWSES